MASLQVPEPGNGEVTDAIAETLARNFGAKVTINVYYNENKQFTSVYDYSLSARLFMEKCLKTMLSNYEKPSSKG